MAAAAEEEGAPAGGGGGRVGKDMVAPLSPSKARVTSLLLRRRKLRRKGVTLARASRQFSIRACTADRALAWVAASGERMVMMDYPGGSLASRALLGLGV